MARGFKDIIILMQRARLGELSEKECKEFQEILKDDSLHQVWQRICQDDFIANRLEEYRYYPYQEAYRQFCKTTRPVKTRNIKRYIVAAVAIVVIGIGITFLWNLVVMQPESGILAENSLIEPGSRKPTLRLTNGQIVEIGKDTMEIKEIDGTQIQYAGGAITYTSTNKGYELAYNELVVPMAGECYIVLEDGTKVWVNAGSKLKYPVKFNNTERRVYLEGEAYFEVTKKGVPFLVNTAWGEVQVLGTSFDVKAYQGEDQMLATLVHGKICFAGNEKVFLKPGEQVLALKNGTYTKRKVNVEEYVSWKEGLFVFKNQRLEEIMKDIARWYNVEVFYQQQQLKDVEFTGNLKRYDRVNVLLELLKSTQEVNYRVTGNTIILYQ